MGKKIFIVLILSLVGEFLNAQSSPLMVNVKIDRLLEHYDTIVEIDFLEQYDRIGMPNMQIFNGFNYPKLNQNTKKSSITLKNDSIQINIKIKNFDKRYFIDNKEIDSCIYYKSLYYQEFLGDSGAYPIYYPEKEVESIELVKNKVSKKLSTEFSKSLYGHNLGYVNAYVTENGKILLTLNCGNGVAAYIVVFVFDKDGNFERRIEQRVI
jgi:hypothetical protein